ncbi:snRNA-activating protein complex subunit [Aristolochia californica]|uniref:snRNA-activating protein complex subunit n=1 Tax=Aristolochia californica TaxID=171875 RepID=UPI0035D9A05A
MVVEEYHQHEQDLPVSCPRGGPIYGPSFVSPMTSIAEFEASIMEELQSLEAELCLGSETFEEELLVDELKVFTEEELVEKALKEALNDGELEEAGKAQISEELSNNEMSLESSDRVCSTSELVAVEVCDKVSSGENGQDLKRRKKKGRAFDRNTRAAELEGGYLTKVKQLAEIKKKQDEDKAAAQLHSLRGSTTIVNAPVPTSEKIEKISSLRFIASAAKIKSSCTHEYVPVHYPDVVLTIEIYHNRRTNMKIQELFVLGKQTLTQLKDNISCVTDELMHKAEQYDPSGYFLIEDVFYNDLRHPSAIDYSEPIFTWLRNCKEEALEKWESAITSNSLQKKQKSMFGTGFASHLPSFKAVDMYKARFCDLHFKLGCGYLYCHQGDCKHIIVIRDMRLIHADDVQNRAAYPIRIFQPRLRHQKCSICKIYFATKVTADDKWAQENPSYFCDDCYFLLHYGKDGSLIYNEFNVYDYQNA